MIKKYTPVFTGTFVSRKMIVNVVVLVLLSFHAFAQTNVNPVTYFEDFNSQGYPTNIPAGGYWTFHNEIYPTQNSWNQFMPGDGYAYLTVDADISNDTDWIHPFQTLEFGGVGENHRLEVRMKGAVVDGGLVGFLFTYNQVGEIFNEVDIEVVANDSATPSHETLPANGGWTDARFNSWRNANENTEQPFTGTKKAVVNQQNQKISLIDGEFHIYTIEWRADRIDFLIDGVLQETITTSVATGMSEVIIGFRQLPWAGNFNWSGTHTLVIDYLKIEPLENIFLATNDAYTIVEDTETTFPVLANDPSNTSIVSFDAISVQGFPVSGTSSELTYTPSGGFIGQDSFTYTIQNSNGEQAIATVNITVEAFVPSLSAGADTLTVAVNSSQTVIDVTANDFYGPNGMHPSHPLTLPGGKLVTASNRDGDIAVVNGNVQYSPRAGFTGIDTFEYTITDGYGYATKGLVTITVGGAVAANAVNDTFDVVVDSATTLNVLANDTAGTTIISYDATSAQGFAITGTTTLLTYTSTGGFLGQDSFTYTITDVNGNNSTATVSITVKAVVVSAGVLSAVDDTITVAVNSANTPIDVTANDNFGVNGPNATHPLTLTNGKIIHASTNGGDIAVVNGKVIYSPRAGFTGIDTFDYTITDGNGFADKGIVTVTVEAIASKTTNTETGMAAQNNTTSPLLENSFVTYPNPSNGYLKTNLYSTLQTKATLVLFDVTGKLVYNKAIDINEGQNAFELQVQLTPGIVFMKVISAAVNYGTTKIIFK